MYYNRSSYNKINIITIEGFDPIEAVGDLYIIILYRIPLPVLENCNNIV